MSTALPELNAAQHAAVQHIATPLLVLAGAGSGKTAVITRKVTALVRNFGFAPGEIAAVTFTNKAAREMKTRVADLLDRDAANRVAISTFHALGLDILRGNLERLGHRPGFSLYDAEDSRGLVAKLLRAARGDATGLADTVHARLSRWKNDLVAPEAALPLAQQAAGVSIEQELLAARVYREYEEHLRAYNAFDFDDLILRPVRLFQDCPHVLDEWRRRIRYLLVDEYQDTNLCQYELVRLLCRGRTGLTVVGDDDQSIYAWRGARPENLRQLLQDFADVKVIRLEQNYRSSGRILRAANALIANNPHVFEKRLWSGHEPGDALRVLRGRSEEHEAERVVAELLYHKFRHGTEFCDFAILFRENHQARALEQVLRERRVPYVLSGAASFFDKTEIKDVMAYLRVLCNPDDDSAFLRVINTPRREIGPATLAQLGAHAAALGTSLLRAAGDAGFENRLAARQLTVLRAFTGWLAETADKVACEEPIKVVCEMLAELHYEDWLRDTCNDRRIAQRKMENVMELVAWLKRLARGDGGAKTLNELIVRLSLLGMLEKEGEEHSGDHVALMTVHSAKGLEFPHVFVVGMEEGLLPHRACLEERKAAAAPPQGDDPAVQEERRLAYVAITRARKSLTFSYAERRRRGGEVIEGEPSRFLKELPAELLHWEVPGAEPDPEASLARAQTYLADLRGVPDKPGH